MSEINCKACDSDCSSCTPLREPKLPAPPPDAKEMIKMALGLTLACAIAAFLTGIAFVLTEPVKKENMIKKEQTVIRRLLSLNESASISEISRFLVKNGPETMIVYQTPSSTIVFNERGEFKEKIEAKGEEALVQKFGKENVSEVGRFFVGRDGSTSKGFVVEGSQMGFKNQIKFFLALDDSLNIRGIEILEHEEDPGLGAEIVKPYLRNQFAGRSIESMSAMEVVKEPLPSDWNIALNELEKTAFDTWKDRTSEKIKSNQKIYAITGATISTVALTTGVKKTLVNFQKRIELLRPYL